MRGLYDMLGNVAEWTWTNYALWDSDDALCDPVGSWDDGVPAGEWSVRGGNFLSRPSELRAAARDGAPAGTRSPGIGFRAARTIVLE